MIIAGISRNGITQHFAINRYSFADLQNKFFTQFNLSLLIGNLLINFQNYIGNGIGFIISIVFPLTFPTALATICTFATIQTYFVHKSVSSLSLRDFNLQKMYIIADHFIKKKEFLTQNEVRQREKIMFFYRVKNLYFCEGKLEKILMNEKDSKYIMNLMTLFNNHRFFVYIKHNKISKANKIYTFMRFDAEGADILKAFIFSILVKNEIENKLFLTHNNYLEILKENLGVLKEMDIAEGIKKLWDLDWNTHFLNLEDKYCRYHIKSTVGESEPPKTEQ